MAIASRRAGDKKTVVSAAAGALAPVGLNTSAQLPLSILILRPWPLRRARKPVWFRSETCGRPTLLSGTAGSQTRKGCTTPSARSPTRCVGCTLQTSSGCKKRKSDAWRRSRSTSAGAQMPGKWQNMRRGPTQRGSETGLTPSSACSKSKPTAFKGVLKIQTDEAACDRNRQNRRPS